MKVRGRRRSVDLLNSYRFSFISHEGTVASNKSGDVPPALT